MLRQSLAEKSQRGKRRDELHAAMKPSSTFMTFTPTSATA